MTTPTEAHFAPSTSDVLAATRAQVLEASIGLDDADTLAVLRLAEKFVPDALAFAHEGCT